MEGFQIGKVARQTQLSVDTIRFYEKEGLLRAPVRNEAGYRLYSEADIRQLLFIREAQELGFSLDEISELLLIQDHRTGACTHVRDVIEQRLMAVRGKLESLKSIENQLKTALAKCDAALQGDKAGPEHECCPVLESIARLSKERSHS